MLMFSLQTTPHLKTHNLSQHVHRIGFHFPSTVVAAVCSELGLYLTSTGKAVPFHTLGTVDNNSQGDPNAPQEVINTEARDTIKDLFPNIPDNDLYQIIKTSFQKVCSTSSAWRHEMHILFYRSLLTPFCRVKEKLVLHLSSL